MHVASEDSMSLKTMFSPADSDLRAVTQAEGVVLLHVRRGMFYRANSVGARIWEKVLAGTCLGDVIDQIGLEFGIPASDITGDVFEFVCALLDQGFLTPKEQR